VILASRNDHITCGIGTTFYLINAQSFVLITDLLLVYNFKSGKYQLEKYLLILSQINYNLLRIDQFNYGNFIDTEF